MLSFYSHICKRVSWSVEYDCLFASLFAIHVLSSFSSLIRFPAKVQFVRLEKNQWIHPAVHWSVRLNLLVSLKAWETSMFSSFGLFGFQVLFLFSLFGSDVGCLSAISCFPFYHSSHTLLWGLHLNLCFYSSLGAKGLSHGRFCIHYRLLLQPSTCLKTRISPCHKCV